MRSDDLVDSMYLGDDVTEGLRRAQRDEGFGWYSLYHTHSAFPFIVVRSSHSFLTVVFETHVLEEVIRLHGNGQGIPSPPLCVQKPASGLGRAS